MNQEFLDHLGFTLAKNGYRTTLETRFEDGYRFHVRLIEKRDPKAIFLLRWLGMDYYPIGTLDLDCSPEYETLTLHLDKNYLDLYDEVQKLLQAVIDDSVLLNFVGPTADLSIKTSA